ncbi:TetR/AcrR family transcriptional regulator [Nocardia sp. CA2R105]|uniref:TetR/AcrR family transcriptional regulator n=1 Tax=Nocardia coffeae TaxID=2873381 RepID=UPI001CA6C23C|nr:TetR/AcrR family transcriptional regulator [Nocardia coffeae]MBY8863579.1 TetR/AcrR family transcriptional regulator [Nocardia coffeae]
MLEILQIETFRLSDLSEMERSIGVSTLRERNRIRARNDVIETALALFEQQGYDATTVDQIARAAGLSSATVFRHFPSKEDILFSEEDDSARAMAECVAARQDPSVDVAALAEPVVKYAAELQDERTHRLTRLVMTTRSLEARSLRMRLRWEREIARTLAAEEGDAAPTLRHTLIASIAISCLSAAVRYWDRSDPSSKLTDLVTLAFEQRASSDRAH